MMESFKKLLIEKLTKEKEQQKKMSLKSNRKKPNKDKIWKKSNYPKKFEKMIRTKFDIKWWNWEKKQSIKKPCKKKRN